jgi:hypothetical protein
VITYLLHSARVGLLGAGVRFSGAGVGLGAAVIGARGWVGCEIGRGGAITYQAR